MFYKIFRTIFKNTLCQWVMIGTYVKFKINIFSLSQFSFFFETNYKKQAQMFYQNHSLALHKIKILRNLILRNHWTWKIWDCLTGLWLTLWYTGLGLAKYFNHLNVVGLIFIIYWKVHRLPNCIWTDFMKYWSWTWKTLELS